MYSITGLIFVAVFALLSTAVRGDVPGGWITADITAREVLMAAGYAVTQHMGDEKHAFLVQEAKSQVVAGTNYELLVRIVDKVDSYCEIVRFLVYDHFGEMSVTSSEHVEDCPHL
mmetsp:Transcript_24644/g.41090  ORF Transcript_24644/g.41090 Transcript_24644/m.41090 type:complete len:115 (+) Transcript_24644:54-398(+)|eukprot:CAMPEP_0174956388 /NCGR_PEP_ID=MMETSP0004_2-20121128/1501_1 /TAXON_ID=420556 /ORGANISM="Ochromonas sp., Strain CCMP1393" /LENGTH=114 /DNA_ID=CAMNT_0016204405 /DNA_START=49 /DNA_END=393 /DNA_ORIENTATION=+